MPFWISFKTDKEAAKKYGILRGPAFVVTDAEAKVQLTYRGMPFTKADAALAWLGELPAKIKAVGEAEARFKDKADDNEARLAMAKAYGDVGRIDEALELYAKAIESLPKDDKRIVDAQCHRGSLATQKNDLQLAAKFYGEVFPRLVEAKDERGVEAGMTLAMTQRRDPAEARKTFLKVAETFPKHERVWEARVMGAMCLLSGKSPDFETATAEIKQVVDTGPADNQWVKNGATYLKAIEARAKKMAEKREPQAEEKPAAPTPKSDPPPKEAPEKPKEEEF
ncbi:MAG: hypothetical protein IT462_09570 [Planctomycetes bacterium]|nr:hypothetical protein [Planctomycetota bacterium]